MKRRSRHESQMATYSSAVADGVSVTARRREEVAGAGAGAVSADVKGWVSGGAAGSELEPLCDLAMDVSFFMNSNPETERPGTATVDRSSVHRYQPSTGER